ncbi:ATP-binding cassette, subfamily B (MDR/TAP), member 9 [Sarotherodon galilaeus]
MFRMEDQYPYRESDRPHRHSKLPSYLQNYEVDDFAKNRLSHDDQGKHSTHPEILQYIHHMKEEHNQLRLDVQRLTELICSSPVLAPQHATSRSGLCEDVTSTTPAHTSKLVPIKGQKSPHQPESAPQVPFGDESQHPKDSQHGLIEELTHSLNEADLDRECSAQSPSPSVDSCPESQDFLPPMTPGERPPSLQASAARGRSPYYAGQRRVDEVYARRHRSYSQPATPPRLPRLGACYEDDPYYRQDDRYPTPGHPSGPDSHYRPPYGYGYQDSNDHRQCPPDRLQPGGCSQTPLSLSRAQPIETYRGPQPTIPDFVHEDPREFARLKLALDNILPLDASEHFKFQILTDHLKCEDALLVADSYSNSPFPFADTMRALTEMYGQPQHLALKRITKLMDGPNIRSGDIRAFKSFALQVRALVGMLHQLGEQGRTELRCGSHVSRLLAKLPYDLRANFQRFVNPINTPMPTLLDLAEWLEYEVRVQVIGDQYCDHSDRERQFQKATTILHGSEPRRKTEGDMSTTQERPKKYCPFCNTVQHYLNQCSNFKLLSKEQKTEWIKANKRCWRCARDHQAAKCKPCGGRHLEVLHDVNTSPDATASDSTSAPEESTCLVSSTSETLYVDQQTNSSQVLLKLSRVIIRSSTKMVETYAILDDGSERTILLHEAADCLGLHGEAENLALRTVRQDICTIHGAAVSFSISPASQPNKSFQIHRAFTAKELGLARHSYPIRALQERYRHLKHLPLPDIKEVQPLLLIGSDNPHLLTPVEPVRLGPPGGPAAVHTRLGWTLQGPSRFLRQRLTPQQCLFTSGASPEAELFSHVERLWKMDTLPYRSERLITRSRQDAEAIQRLEERTIRVTIDGVNRYATPLLWKKNLPPSSCYTRGKPQKAAAYSREIQKLLQAGFVTAVAPEEAAVSNCSWFIPHHMVHHNGKDRIVFNCSFTYKGQSLNDCLLPGPTLGASLLGVLLRFREHPVAFSSDIKGMFHQVRLLDEDKPFLCFLWRDMKVDEKPTIYQWQVLPFGTTCSPCCATFALQEHVKKHTEPGEDARLSIERNFYVDNCLQSLPSEGQAKKLVDRLQSLLLEGGFELRQWASNVHTVISHLPVESQSEGSILWLSQESADPQERTLGLVWHCKADALRYKHQQSVSSELTMRNIYRLLAQQYDPLGFLIPYTTRAKVIVQHLWDKKRGWDDPHLPENLLQAWRLWESELGQLSQITLPRCYTDSRSDGSNSHRSLHVFCDASERAYGSVAYLRTDQGEGKVQVAFLAARSRVAPKKQLSIPRLELCGALTGAQLASVLKKELTLDIQDVGFWTDSTTVLNWLHSDSCRYKVFVGTRVAEVQELSAAASWRYVDSGTNPADDITRGKTVAQLAGENCWSRGPPFLQLPPSLWPQAPVGEVKEEVEELKKPVFCGLLTGSASLAIPGIKQFSTYEELLKATARLMHGAANDTSHPDADDFQKAELALLRHSQMESFPREFTLLKSEKLIPSSSRLITLAPEYDKASDLIRVGDRLRRCESLSPEVLHPVLLEPAHPVTKLLIQRCDNKLNHPGAERVFAELRRKYWILKGREAVRRHQHYCPECKKWRGQPDVPKMADLPPSSLRLFRPAFYSTGMDCFGPMLIKVGRCTEKRWGILFKCLTTRAVHLDLLVNMDVDSFLMSLRRFIARRGKPFELLSDQGTNFRGASKELQEAFTALTPDLRQQLAAEQIRFCFNPSSAPHFGGSWEREVRSVKTALRTTLGAQIVSEEVLRTVLLEVESILNSRPLGYVSSDIADPDPITPYSLLMGRPDCSLPQVFYPESELLSRKRWRHTQVLADQFWKHFVRHFMPTLQLRQKWHKETDNIAVGSVVLIVDQQTPRALWQVGTVKTILPGADDRVRAAVVQVKDRTYTWPVARLIRLPVLPQDSA